MLDVLMKDSGNAIFFSALIFHIFGANCKERALPLMGHLVLFLFRKSHNKPKIFSSERMTLAT
jgi:hypothetical protein